ncbi:type IV pili methyl-accepting chemotaxis transducer N-terminal domain-containing protein [Bordetella petrii]|uniref:type IV pili methyl-accepting chemotaxis transducer N-terminal domain-containing protein n=1 Tax=Bordetella petrii TaxID=94624 RepID=UPI001E32ED6E|nr:type IV pili methyl-accepting chemotaxis transducer N-terminal domain-containing protein [Bordetella petrii]MCD0501537.1 type IV pili methyl-accepting chemotaxis transducer N-terminal domain-containing protein [Bordetella petrii]
MNSSEFPVGPDGLPSLRDRLSTRIITSSLIALAVVLSMVAWSLWLSWGLEGAGAAINDTGSLRMTANHVAVELMRPAPARAEQADELVRKQDETLALLERGNSARPLFLPADPAIRAQLDVVTTFWDQRMKPAVALAQRDANLWPYLDALPGFVAEADKLVRMIEADNAGKTTLLRLSQGVLTVIGCVGTLAMIYLLYLWIISPVLRLRDGLQRMTAGEFSARLPVESRDEFGVLAHGFNLMADKLESLYRSLENRVRRKTAELEAQNRDIGALYDMAAFLNQPNSIEAVCRGFLQRVMTQFKANGGTIRTLNPTDDKLSMMVSEGLSEELAEAERCMRADQCYCGTVTQEGTQIVRDFRKLTTIESFHCANEGFRSLAVFRIVAREEVLGSFSLHFNQPTRISPAETQLLETLGQHLGVALENRRLDAKARQLAVVRERNLMAQGLHDSIAQGLNFLKLQLQLLDDALARGDKQEIEEIVPLLRTGVEESYQDVRELLVNFRTKLEQGELPDAIRVAVERFQRQTGIEVELDQQYGADRPLPPEQQLQVLFILQEALSNVRKHAEAGRVRVRLRNDRDFEMEISDDGVGYDPESVEQQGENHVGLHIMRERAARLNAVIKLSSRPGAGATVQLLLPGAERRAA